MSEWRALARDTLQIDFRGISVSHTDLSQFRLRAFHTTPVIICPLIQDRGIPSDESRPTIQPDVGHK